MFNRMVERLESGSDSLGRVFGALADPTRRQILARLRDGKATIGALAEPLPMSLAAVSKHVQVLERAGLLQREVRGRQHLISLDAAGLREAADWMFAHSESRDDPRGRALRARTSETNKSRRRR